jgi:hypothetical protein
MKGEYMKNRAKKEDLGDYMRALALKKYENMSAKDRSAIGYRLAKARKVKLLAKRHEKDAL